MQGRTLDEAMQNNEFMYIQFWDRLKDGDSLEDLLKLQESMFKDSDSECSIEFLPTIRRENEKTKLRVVNIKNYPTPEYTGFVEFEDFIFFCVMFSPVNRSKSNIRKLENIMEAVLPIKIKHQDANASMQPTTNA